MEGVLNGRWSKREVVSIGVSRRLF